MTDAKALLLLHQQALQQADKAAHWLNLSLTKAAKIKIRDELTENEFDILENLSSRFTRLWDILVQKNFRAIDALELESGGSIIDVINRAAKRGLAPDEQLMRTMKELRNTISYEYTLEKLVRLFDSVRKLSPKLLDVFENVKKNIVFQFK